MTAALPNAFSPVSPLHQHNRSRTMTDLPPCQAASELRRLTDAALSAVAPDGAVLRHLHLDGGKLTLIDESGAPALSLIHI